jgi:DNA-binding transcriptional ArsR family regulator
MKKLTVIGALGALAQETRLDLFRLLVQKGSAGLAAGEIGERLGLPSPTLSFHLNQLRFAGLITSRRESRSII